MQEPPAELQARLTPVSGLASDGIRAPEDLGSNASRKDCQRGGEKRAGETLRSFLSERGLDYRKAMSSPLTGATACSRLSPYLAWGCISIRETVRALEQRTRKLRDASAAGADVNRGWFASLRSFGARLRWHCHFMQKLEDEPRIEFENVHRGYDGLREEMTASPEGLRRLRLWQEGHTGYPMVDACIRSCLATGWLNFRMRAMVASFAAYHLWLHWRAPAVFLARHFLDFEAGIHFPQFQMQSGTTGINTLRIYSPAKQMLDQDPSGEFVRRWVPELQGVPLEYLSEPHRMPEHVQRACGCRIDVDYPAPVVDHATAYRAARERFSAVRRTPAAREEAKAVLQRHGSRKKNGPAKRPRLRRPEPQMELFRDDTP
jgi:deoxyribodipyrimidine photo-lyase